MADPPITDRQVLSAEAQAPEPKIENVPKTEVAKAIMLDVFGDLLQQESKVADFACTYLTDFEEKGFNDLNSLTEQEIQARFVQISEKVANQDKLSPQEVVKALRTIEYVHAYAYLTQEAAAPEWQAMGINERHQKAKIQNELLHTFHKNVEAVITTQLEAQDTDEARGVLERQKQDAEKEKNSYGNIKVFRGMNCNASCVFCFQENSADQGVSQYVTGNRTLEYTDEQLMRSLLYARLAYKVREVSYTGGETFANKPQQFCADVAVAKKIGFPQISTMTNGRLLTPEAASNLEQAGLTHLIISLHTTDALTHFRIMNWKDIGNTRRNAVNRILAANNWENNETNKKKCVEIFDDERRALGLMVDGYYEQPKEGVPPIGEPKDENAAIAREVIKNQAEAIYSQITKNIHDVAHGTNLAVRLNIAYNLPQMGGSVQGVIEMAHRLGAKELTFIEMIEGNDVAKGLFSELPDDKFFANLGYNPIDTKNWTVGGIRIYLKNKDPLKIATCNFGQLNGVGEAIGEGEQYATFKGQSKEVILHPLGNLGDDPYSNANPTMYDVI